MTVLTSFVHFVLHFEDVVVHFPSLSSLVCVLLILTVVKFALLLSIPKCFETLLGYASCKNSTQD